MLHLKSMLLFHHTNRKVCMQHLHSASSPPISCRFNFLPYMVKVKRCRQKEEEEKKGLRAEGWRKVWFIVFQMV